LEISFDSRRELSKTTSFPAFYFFNYVYPLIYIETPLL